MMVMQTKQIEALDYQTVENAIESLLPGMSNGEIILQSHFKPFLTVRLIDSRTKKRMTLHYDI